jgi:flagellar protein FliJ
MPRFKFQLQSVLEHREVIERQKQRAVAELEVQRVRLENLIRECQRGLVAEAAALRECLGASNIRGVRQQAAASMRLTVAAQRAALELAGVHKRIEAARADLLVAAKRRKAVDLLKERRRDEWRAEESRRELAAIDELAVMRAGARSMEL